MGARGYHGEPHLPPLATRSFRENFNQGTRFGSFFAVDGIFLAIGEEWKVG